MTALDAASALPEQFPYSFFAQNQQTRIHGGVAVADKPAGYAPPCASRPIRRWAGRGHVASVGTGRSELRP
jgi:hypothetical protein